MNLDKILLLVEYKTMDNFNLKAKCYSLKCVLIFFLSGAD